MEREHRSVSQLNLYKRCPQAYKLSRIDRVWQRPAAWLAQGSAVHEAIEAWEKSGRSMTLEDAQDVFRESYSRHINEACEVTPDFKVWFRSGPYDGQTDTERRYTIGLGQVEKYLNWNETHPDEVIWVHEDGTPGIELAFYIDLDGVPVRGFIDAVVEVDGEIRVRDHKTGNTPGDDFQLGVYAVALQEQFGIDKPNSGDYWMGKSGKPTILYPLHEWTREKVSAAFAELEANIQAGRFDPNPEPSKCRFCDVSASCQFSM